MGRVRNGNSLLSLCEASHQKNWHRGIFFVCCMICILRPPATDKQYHNKIPRAHQKETLFGLAGDRRSSTTRRGRLFFPCIKLRHPKAKRHGDLTTFAGPLHLSATALRCSTVHYLTRQGRGKKALPDTDRRSSSRPPKKKEFSELMPPHPTRPQEGTA